MSETAGNLTAGFMVRGVTLFCPHCDTALKNEEKSGKRPSYIFTPDELDDFETLTTCGCGGSFYLPVAAFGSVRL